MSLELEIERKIILKRLPDIGYDDIIKIDQYYFKNENNEWERYRKSKIGDKIQYFKTIKKGLREGVCMEDESNISKKEFKKNVKKCDRKISKTRHIKKVENDLFWEVDVFNDMTLIMAEIEIPSEDYEVTYPQWIEDNIISDVTNIREFSNRRMSEKI
jgi:CYTH domain-containing protein